MIDELKLQEKILETKITHEDTDALNGSIAKWTGILAGAFADQAADDCPLCQLRAKRAAESTSHLDGYCVDACIIGVLLGGCKALGYNNWLDATLSNIGDRLIRENYQTQEAFERAYRCAKTIHDNLETLAKLISYTKDSNNEMKRRRNLNES